MNDREFFDRVASILAGYKYLDATRLAEVTALMERHKIPFEHALSQVSPIDQAAYKRVLEEASGCLCVDPSQMTIDPAFVESMLKVLPLEALVVLQLFPVTLAGNELTLAMRNPTDHELLRDLEAISGVHVKPVVSTVKGLANAVETQFAAHLKGLVRDLAKLDRGNVLGLVAARRQQEDAETIYDTFLGFVNRDYERASEDPERLRLFVADPITIAYVRWLVGTLVGRHTSDLHFEPRAFEFRVRARVNGVLKTFFTLPRKAGEAVTMRLKMMAGLPLAPAATPQDAQINYSPLYQRRIEFRFSALPTIHGEKIVMRVLEKSGKTLTLESTGLFGRDAETVRRNIAKPNGLVLVTGPTGSGKTSTLYAVLSVLNDDERCIVTAEEPVESEVEGVIQVGCGPAMSFAQALRAFLRQDPDVIMVGEIRDAETADIALKAALTGHLVLSTLHTNDAPSAVMRLLNLGMDPFVVASSLRMVVAQRLARRLCGDCKRAASRDELTSRYPAGLLPVEGTGEIFLPGSCARCNQTGYSGRQGVFEILETSDRLAEAVNARASLTDIRALARAGGMRTLRESALDLAAAGVTSLEEVLRITAD